MAENVLDNRTGALSTFSGLGPPDLCRVSKTETRLTGYCETSYFHHYLVGIDVLDYHSVTAYIHGLMDTVETPFSPLSSALGTRMRIDSATYCCFDLFSGCDIRIIVKVPGIPGVTVTCVSPSGESIESVPQSVWEGAFLSSYFRYTTCESLDIIPLHVMPNLAAPQFGPIVHKLLGTYIALSDESGQCVSEPANAFVHAVAKTYLKQYRLGEAMELFASLQSLYPPIVSHIAKIYMKKKQPDAAVSVLLRSLRTFPENDHQLIQLGYILNDYELRRSAVELAVSVAPGNFWTWINRSAFFKEPHVVFSFLETAFALYRKEFADVKKKETDRIHGEPLLMGPGTGLSPWFDDTAARIDQQANLKESVDALSKCELAIYRVLRKMQTTYNGKDENLLRIAKLLCSDIKLVDDVKVEISQRGNKPWLPFHSSALWIERAHAAYRLDQLLVFEVSARMALIYGPNLNISKKLLKLYTKEFPRESILVLFQIWKWFEPTFTPSPIKAAGYLACHSIPPWLQNLIARTAFHVGSARIRNAVSDPKLAVLDQFLATASIY